MAPGIHRSLFVADTAAHTGDWGEIHAVSAATFSSLTSGVMAGGSTVVMDSASGTTDVTGGMVIPAGDSIFGRFTAFTLSAGKVIAYTI